MNIEIAYDAGKQGLVKHVNYHVLVCLVGCRTGSHACMVGVACFNPLCGGPIAGSRVGSN